MNEWSKKTGTHKSQVKGRSWLIREANWLRTQLGHRTRLGRHAKRAGVSPGICKLFIEEFLRMFVPWDKQPVQRIRNKSCSRNSRERVRLTTDEFSQMIVFAGRRGRLPTRAYVRDESAAAGGNRFVHLWRRSARPCEMCRRASGKNTRTSKKPKLRALRSLRDIMAEHNQRP